jgi:beta-barrel assembly-enhancing protease
MISRAKNQEMKFFSLSACCAPLCLIVYLTLVQTSAVFSTTVNEGKSVRLEDFRANLLTADEERIVGQRLAYLYEQRHTPLRDAEAQARLNRIAARLGSRIRAQALVITIIQGALPEAVSFPPGRIFITSALIKLTQTDDELAAVIAHEAAHVASHHLARLIALAETLPVGERDGFPSRSAIIRGQTLQFVFPPSLDRVRLDYEIEADQMAVRCLESAGYKGEALAQLLGKLSAQLSPNVLQEEEKRAALRTRLQLLARLPLLSLKLHQRDISR